MTQEEFNRLVAIWLRRGTWAPKEAARLLSEQNPHRPQHVSLDAPETGLAWHILDLILSFPEFRNEQSPSDWIGWAVDRQLHINPAFQHHAKPTPAQSTATLDIMVAVGASDGVESEKARPVAMVALPKQRVQEHRILELLKIQGCDPLKLPSRMPGKTGTKAKIKTLALLETALFSDKTFDTAWQRLRGYGDVREG